MASGVTRLKLRMACQSLVNLLNLATPILETNATDEENSTNILQADFKDAKKHGPDDAFEA